MIHWRLLIMPLATLLVVACSRDLGGNGQTGTGTGQGGHGGSGGTGGTFSGGGRGGEPVAGAGGTAGAGGASMLAVCPTGTPTFSVCVVSDADILPLSNGSGGSPETARDSITAAAATVEAIGTGAAPAQCSSARVFGATTSSDWWLQVRTADTKLWTIGLAGLGNALNVQIGDHVTFDLQHVRMPQSPFAPGSAVGSVQLSDAAGTPLLWAGADTVMASWLTLDQGQPICGSNNNGCMTTRYEVIATVNGSVATLAPFSATYIGGYYFVAGALDQSRPALQTECAHTAAPPFPAAAVKAP